MARRGNNCGNPHLQVGSRLTSLCLAVVLAFAAPAAGAATKKPTPKPTAKVTAKASAKASAKPTVKATSKTTSKPTAKASAKASSKPTVKASAKPTATKKPVVKKKKKKRAKVRVSPSPKAAWPPKGFSVEGEVYAKVPTAKELVGLISANSYLSKQIKQCTTYICGAVQVASETGCLWWEAIANITDAQGDKLGELNTSFNSSSDREFKVLLLISPETVEKGGAAKITSVICHHEDRDKSLPGTSYKKS
ncbi:hypothetical protein MCEMRE182_00312 [Candidatus Nanopelagicaceae bacterium]